MTRTVFLTGLCGFFAGAAVMAGVFWVFSMRIARWLHRR